MLLALALALDVGDVGRGLDLLRRADPALDLFRGACLREGGPLQLDAASRLQLPCKPPEEYVLELEVVRVTDKGKLLVGLASGPNSFDVVIDNWHEGEHRAGMTWLDGKHVTEYPARRGSVFENGRVARLSYRVQKGGVVVTADGAELVRFEGDFARVRTDPRYLPPASGTILLATELSRFRILRAVLRPLTNGTVLLAGPGRCPLPTGTARWGCERCRRVLVGGDNPVAPRCCGAPMTK